MGKSLKYGNRLPVMAIRSFSGGRELTGEKTSVLLILLIAPYLCVIAEEAIIPFDEAWAVKLAGKYVTTSFSPEEPGSYTTGRPWTLGFGLRYKNSSLSLFLPSLLYFWRTVTFSKRFGNGRVLPLRQRNVQSSLNPHRPLIFWNIAHTSAASRVLRFQPV